MSRTLFKNAVFHPMTGENETFSFMTVENGIITGTYSSKPDGNYKEIDLNGQHVYPCLIDGHTHLLYTIAVMAMGFDACEITDEGVKPNNIDEIGKKIEKYCCNLPTDAVVAINNYILSAVKEKRLPDRKELDRFSGNRAVVLYNIDGHCSALSTKMLEKIGIDPNGHSGILTGEENDRNQGKLTEVVAKSINIKTLAKGIGIFHNTCAKYGICMVGALEGNGDNPNDSALKLFFSLARRFDLQVRFYFQFMDEKNITPFIKHLKRKRIGGCGDWEMDGSVGAHSAAFNSPYKDSGKINGCYYEKDFVNEKVRSLNRAGFQVSSHAIGEKAIDYIVDAMNASDTDIRNRIEHIEFINDEELNKLDGSKYSAFMQPGYAWIDKRFLHTYEMYLPEKIEKNLKLKSIMDHGVDICGSSDSPVQALDPYLQMLGMVQFYNEKESLSLYEALKSYTVNPARAMYEDDMYGTLEKGKRADFMCSNKNFFKIKTEEIASFLPNETYYGGEKYKQKTGSIGELLELLIKKPHEV